MLSVPILITLIILLISLWWYINKKKYEGLLKLATEPKAIPILNHLLYFNDNAVDKMNTLMRLAKEHNYFYKVALGPAYQFVVVADPKFFEFVLTSQKLITKSLEYDLLMPWLGQGLLTSTGSYWHKKRKILTPSFHFKILEEFLPVFDSMGQVFVKKLVDKIGKDPFDVYPMVTAYTLDTICETAMGATVDAQNKDSAYVRAVGDMRAVFLRRNFSLWKRIDCLFTFSEDYRLQKRSLEIIHGFTKSVIEKRKREKRLRDSGKKTEDEDLGIKRRQAFLDLILESKIDGRDWTEEEIREEVDTFMFEGHDTTASAITFSLFELAHHQNVQDKVVSELRSIFGDHIERPITNQDLQEMKYLDLVIKETLRMYPSVPLLGRKVVEETEYEGVKLPKGLSIILFPYCMQRREDLFENAKEFNPDRFLSDQMNKANSFTYVPFSAGPRNCIGQKFAIMEMKCILAKILMKVKIQPGDNKYPITDLSGEIILKSEENIFLTVAKR